MKLAILGGLTLAIGVAQGIDGLTWIGGFWVVMGLPAWLHGQRLKSARAGELAVDARMFYAGTALLLGIGVPSLVVGMGRIGFEDGTAWRWLPLVVGIFTVGIAVLGAVLFSTGRAIGAADSGAKATVPATIWIRAMRETGTRINDRPRIELDLRVEPEAETGAAAYEVTKGAVVPFTALGSLRIGHGFRALVVGPDDPEAMQIAWDQPVAGDVDQA